MKKRTFYIISTILLIAIIIVVGSTISQRNTRTEIEAEAPTTPMNLRVSQITQDSATIEWETEADFGGYIMYGENSENLNFIAIDIKGSTKYQKHEVTIENLESNKKYFYVIISEKDTYQLEGKPFEFSTLE